jgi:hypothetical protein
MKCY